MSNASEGFQDAQHWLSLFQIVSLSQSIAPDVFIDLHINFHSMVIVRHGLVMDRNCKVQLFA